jgi:hypothetical protein
MIAPPLVIFWYIESYAAKLQHAYYSKGTLKKQLFFSLFSIFFEHNIFIVFSEETVYNK